MAPYETHMGQGFIKSYEGEPSRSSWRKTFAEKGGTLMNGAVLNIRPQRQLVG